MVCQVSWDVNRHLSEIDRAESEQRDPYEGLTARQRARARRHAAAKFRRRLRSIGWRIAHVTYDRNAQEVF